MSEGETRGRCLLVCCFVGGVVLAMFGLYRWPPQTVVVPSGGSFTRPARLAERHTFIVDRSRFDVALGLADYLSSALLFVLGIVFWVRGVPKRRWRRRALLTVGDDALPAIFVVLSGVAGLVLTLIGAGALASVLQA